MKIPNTNSRDNRRIPFSRKIVAQTGLILKGLNHSAQGWPRIEPLKLTLPSAVTNHLWTAISNCLRGSKLKAPEGRPKIAPGKRWWPRCKPSVSAPPGVTKPQNKPLTAKPRVIASGAATANLTCGHSRTFYSDIRFQENVAATAPTLSTNRGATTLNARGAATATTTTTIHFNFEKPTPIPFESGVALHSPRSRTRKIANGEIASGTSTTVFTFTLLNKETIN